MKKSEVNWSEAGKKSWVTRRSNELKRKRSEAGKKSWETRRKNAMVKSEKTQVVEVAEPVEMVEAKPSAPPISGLLPTQHPVEYPDSCLKSWQRRQRRRSGRRGQPPSYASPTPHRQGN